MKRRPSPLRRTGAGVDRVGDALARRSARRVQLRLYDRRGQGQPVDPESAQGAAMLAAAREMLDAAPRRAGR